MEVYILGGSVGSVIETGPTSQTTVKVGKDSIMFESERFKRMSRILHEINQSLVDIFRYAMDLV